MSQIKDYVAQNQDRFIEELFSLIRIPSVSAKSEHKGDMIACANRWAEILMSSGLENVEVMPTDGNPVVYADKIISPDYPTVLVYGHYDVMPEEPVELWKSPAFEPEIRDGYIWARGADDDKGQSMIQVKGFETANKLGLVKCNVKVILEGEEEVGSASLAPFCEKYKEKLKADVILVSDTGMLAKDIPSITTGLRGLAYWEIEVTGPNRDLHSGHYGGAVANPINELCVLMSKMIDENGRITIPEFYDDVLEISPAEREMIAAAPFNEEEYKKALDIKAVKGEAGFHTLERNSCRPSFDICGIWGGYTGEGAKTVLPSKAYAKVSTRLVANQDFRKISQDFVKYIEDIAPDYIKVKVTPLHGGEAYLCPIDMPAYKVAEEAYLATFGKKPLGLRTGGSIPIIATFERILGIKTILMGFGLESDAIHSPNENFPVDLFYKGIETVATFYSKFGH
ncbi:dipeptidase [Porphyromonas sp.]|uniref:dipeptidase n=1 Tax=Porphyromonas sp. TaxID=1924944 RepID=UPI0026DC1A56|nr:dipeptidase [Porphyromonas sp.]MDO4695209.1 dipeptidase [Porphyromonas sp.]MDO4770991.1 dipeptidase [Porphyromonas sp.]